MYAFLEVLGLNLSDVANMAWDIALTSMIHTGERKRELKCVSTGKIRNILMNIERGNLNVLKNAEVNPPINNRFEAEKIKKKFSESVILIGNYASQMNSEGVFDDYFTKLTKYVLWDIEDLERSLNARDFNTNHFKELMKAEGIPQSEIERNLGRILALKRETERDRPNSGYKNYGKNRKGGR